MSEITESIIRATRKKYRFPTPKGGEYTIEDLWDLPLTALDNIAQGIDEQIQKQGRKSLLRKRNAASTELNDQYSIIEYIVNTKQEEADSKKARAEKLQRAETLKELLSRKRLQELEGKSAEELQKEIEELENATS